MLYGRPQRCALSYGLGIGRERRHALLDARTLTS